MQRVHAAGLNVSGEEGLTRIFSDGAVHFSQSQQTSAHAHNAWKVHVGVDAPVWLQSEELTVGPDAQVRVLVVPPNVTHATGAVGVSMAAFISPGSRGTGLRGSAPFTLTGLTARRVVSLCRSFAAHPRRDTPAFVDALADLTLPPPNQAADLRVTDALEHLSRSPCTPLPELARAQGLSLDRLSRLVSAHTGLTLRRHALWRKVLMVMSMPRDSRTLAAVAYAAGFSDHAHMTRTFRSLIGRAPSEFRAPPDVLAPWV